MTRSSFADHGLLAMIIIIISDLSITRRWKLRTSFLTPRDASCRQATMKQHTRTGQQRTRRFEQRRRRRTHVN
jgi:hypothetical protein